MTVAEALRWGAARLAATSDSARLDAEVLMAHALGASRSDMLLCHQQDEAPSSFAALIERRERHEPVAYIVGSKEFYGLEFEVNSSVLIPRADSETLIDAARESLADRPPQRILDLGTGSGALLLAAMMIWPEAEGVGVDRDIRAIIVAHRNAERLRINERPSEDHLAEHFGEEAAAVGWIGRARFNGSDWRNRGWGEHFGRFDLILANPPYVEDDAPIAPDVRQWEPEGALFAGPDGLDAYRVLIPQLPGLLTENGVAVLEIGATQADQVADIAAQSGFTAEMRRDLGGRPRVLILRLGLGK